MLRQIQNLTPSADIFRIASAHPAGIMAASRAFTTGISSIDINFIREYGWYLAPGATGHLIKDHPQLHDLLDWDRSEYSIFTEAWVDRTEINAVLEHLCSKPSLVSKERVRWPLGELPEGHEFVAVFKNQGKREGERKVPVKWQFDDEFVQGCLEEKKWERKRREESPGELSLEPTEIGDIRP